MGGEQLGQGVRWGEGRSPYKKPGTKALKFDSKRSGVLDSTTLVLGEPNIY